MSKLPKRFLVGLGEFSLGLFLIAVFSGLSSIDPAVANNSVKITTETTGATSSVNLNIFQALILGLIQGLTEFLPISSTAHLKVVPVLLGWGDPGVAATAIVQLGSIAAVLWFFAADLRQILGGTILAIQKKNYMSQDFRLAAGIVFGSLPIILGGLCLKIFVPNYDSNGSPWRSLTTIAFASIIMSLLLAVAEKIGTHKRKFEKVNPMDGIIMGLAQALALIPGVSRSGSTMTAGLFRNLERATAARYSFLLGIPAITLAGLVELKDLLSTGIKSNELLPLVVGVVSAAVFSYLAIVWLIRYLQNQNTWVFVWYRLIFGILILIAVQQGILKNL
jgi:undecaprenyl-diphosphatase